MMIYVIFNDVVHYDLRVHRKFFFGPKKSLSIVFSVNLGVSKVHQPARDTSLYTKFLKFYDFGAPILAYFRVSKAFHEIEKI